MTSTFFERLALEVHAAPEEVRAVLASVRSDVDDASWERADLRCVMTWFPQELKRARLRLSQEGRKA
jgi:hypothetical protein